MKKPNITGIITGVVLCIGAQIGLNKAMQTEAGQKWAQQGLKLYTDAKNKVTGFCKKTTVEEKPETEDAPAEA